MLNANVFTLSAVSATPATTTGGVAGVDEVQELAVDATGGSFAVTYGGQTTVAINFDASGATFTTALDNLSNLAPGDIVVTGGPGDSGATQPYVLTFGGTLAETPVAEITADATLLTGGAATATPSTTTAGVAPVNEVQTITFANATGGTFTITYDGQTTAAIAYPPTAATLTSALEALSNIGVGDVAPTYAADVVTITFTGALAGTPVAEVTATVTSTTNAQQINDEHSEPVEFHVHTTDTMYLGNDADTCEYLIPQDYPQEVEFSLGETVFARGTGTIYTLATGLSETPER